ncbi:MAG TPA: hypothetical protein VGE01_10870 [Fimbriimonas sp.]
MLARDALARRREIDVPSPPKPIPATTVLRPGRSAISLRDPSRSSEKDVRRAIQERQHEDYLRLVARLRDFYSADALRFEQEQLRAGGIQSVEAFERANERIREVFVRYGEERAPLVADLALLVGFPDPNPEGVTPSVPLGNVDRQRLAKANELRQQIQILEAEFDQKVAAILGEVETENAALLADLRERIRKYRVENDAKAERDAAQQVQEDVRALGLQLTEQVRLTLPGVPTQATTLPAAPAPKPAPEVSSAGILTSLEDRRLLVGRQVQIWSAQRRYQIVDSPNQGQDLTDEFIAWRKDLLSGR